MWIRTYPQDFAIEEVAHTLLTLAEQSDANSLLLGGNLHILQYLGINVASRDAEAAHSQGQDRVGVKGQSGDQGDQAIAAILHLHPQAPLHPSVNVKQSGSDRLSHLILKAEGPLLMPVSGLANDLWCKLIDIVNDVNALDPTQLAQEINWMGAELFIQIKVCLSTVLCITYVILVCSRGTGWSTLGFL